jgi:hypothetical protein
MSKRQIGLRALAAILSVDTLLVTGAPPASAACAEIWVGKFGSVRATQCTSGAIVCTSDSDKGRPVEFRAGDQFVLCVKVPFDAYVTLWDAAPQSGDVRRLYPNILSHQNNAHVYGDKMTGGAMHCFGQTDFPLYFPRAQGAGSGRLTVFATATLEAQPRPEDMPVPGEQMKRARHDLVAQTLNAGVDCKVQYSHSVYYNISN